MSVQLVCEWGTRLGLFKCEDKAMEDLRTQFANHAASYGLSYGTEDEYDYRFKLYALKDNIINEINSDPENTFTVGHNKFSTWTAEEYSRLLGLKNHVDSSSDGDEELKLKTKPTVWLDAPRVDAIDWRTKGIVNPIRDQG